MPLTKGEAFDRTTGLLSKEGDPLKIRCSGGPAVARYYYRLVDDRMTEFCVENARGPQSVETLSRDGQHIPWESYWDGELLVFKCPPGCDPSIGIFWAYDKRLQVGKPYPREMLERKSLGMRASIVVP